MRPTGYYILIEMEEVENVSQGGIIMATKNEHSREKGGHDVGIIKAFGPTAFEGFRGVDAANVEDRAGQYGVKLGDRVEFNRYDGKTPRHPDYSDFRIIQDEHIIGVYDD